jgi:hypothetical protein
MNKLKFACCSRWIACVVLDYCARDSIEEIKYKFVRCKLGSIFTTDPIKRQIFKNYINSFENDFLAHYQKHYNKDLHMWFNANLKGGQ